MTVKSIQQKEVRMDKLRFEITIPRQLNFTDMLGQGRMAEGRSFEGFLNRSQGRDGLEFLAAGFAITFSGPDLVPEIQRGESAAMMKIDLLKQVLETVSDKLWSILQPDEYVF